MKLNRELCKITNIVETTNFRKIVLRKRQYDFKWEIYSDETEFEDTA